MVRQLSLHSKFQVSKRPCLKNKYEKKRNNHQGGQHQSNHTQGQPLASTCTAQIPISTPAWTHTLVSNDSVSQVLITFKVHLQGDHKTMDSYIPCNEEAERNTTVIAILIWSQSCPCSWQSPQKQNQWNGEGEKNHLYMAISFDTRLINSPAFPGHAIIYPICQSWYLTTLSSELLACQEEVYLVNHRKMTGSLDRISDKRKRGTQEQMLGHLLARNSRYDMYFE